jgi:hypothetical protein
MASIAYTFNSSIGQGPSFSTSGTIDAAAYDKVNISVDPTKDVSVNVQPMPPAKVMFLGVKSDVHDENLTYTTDGKTMKLDRDHVFIGSSPISLLGNITIFKIKNNTQTKANIEILVGREAVVEDKK